ncbi:hypothetical protein Q1W71_23415 [Flavobacterium pectinovorum]|uniref:hypothetical protein n=1 Tax=Flavobacterium pectinovorum TaxID=29533 RepID=UPI00265F7445|nr:hypothetical protein [Flavobacterium pectinovorum]WKL47886.1 hypothetical protein Q1W71_23415 [Flavobacterium pectinovorum]
MNKILIILFYFFFLNSFSQNVSVVLLVEQKKADAHLWKKYSSDVYPFLQISYINNTKDSIYLKKVAAEFDFITTGLMKDYNRNTNLRTYLKNLKKHTNQKYSVNIPISKFHNYWEVLEADHSIADEHDISFINEQLHFIYDCFYKKNNSNTKTVEDRISVANIGKIESKYFIFLKPGEKVIEYYDLTGFKLLGGTYDFMLDKNQADDFMETDFLSDQKIYKREALPETLKGYKLYKGLIGTNTARIIF